MKLEKKLNRYVLFVHLVMLLIFFSCKKKDDFTKEFNPNSNTPTLTQAHLNKAAESLSFKSGVINASIKRVKFTSKNLKSS